VHVSVKINMQRLKTQTLKIFGPLMGTWRRLCLSVGDLKYGHLNIELNLELTKGARALVSFYATILLGEPIEDPICLIICSTQIMKIAL